MVDVLLGLQWGDEGKGKIVDFFAPDYDIIARFQGGPNAGHTLYVNDKKVVLHQIPSGIFHENTINLVGNGVVLDAVTLKRDRSIIRHRLPQKPVHRRTYPPDIAYAPGFGQSIGAVKRQ
jgi:adenylosuccinate synthase